MNHRVSAQDDSMFTAEDRDQVRERILRMAEEDPRVVAAAAVGSFAVDQADRWSDLDLMFAVADEKPLQDVLEEWSRTLTEELGAVHLFDLVSGPIVYRVFLLPDRLELDLSFTTASTFAPGGPRFRLLFGKSLKPVARPVQGIDEVFGYAVHHVLHARVAVERGRSWLAEYWISAARDRGLELACRRRGLDGSYGRGYDDLPIEVRNAFEAAIVRSLDAGELRRALAAVVPAVLAETVEVGAMAGKVAPQLRELASGR
jgi:predicted nucleotidyltransferase